MVPILTHIYSTKFYRSHKQDENGPEWTRFRTTGCNEDKNDEPVLNGTLVTNSPVSLIFHRESNLGRLFSQSLPSSFLTELYQTWSKGRYYCFNNASCEPPRYHYLILMSRGDKVLNLPGYRESSGTLSDCSPNAGDVVPDFFPVTGVVYILFMARNRN